MNDLNETTDVNQYKQRRESLIEVAQTVTELEAIMILGVMRQRFKWQGVMFTRWEVACQWATQREEDPNYAEDEEESIFKSVSSTASWKRLSHYLNILGWGLLEDAVLEAQTAQELKADHNDA